MGQPLCAGSVGSFGGVGEGLTGSDLTTEMLWAGYTQGWFPMTVDEESGEVEWFRPRKRCLFPLEGIRVSRSLAKTIRRGGFEVTFDRAFEEVMRGCLRGPGENWLSEEFVRVYGEAFREGWAHSCEVWVSGELVGGIYGLAVGKVFSAESMFHRRTDMSKVALWAMVERCREAGFGVFDAQIMNPHLASLGAYEVSDGEYRTLLVRGLGEGGVL